MHSEKPIILFAPHRILEVSPTIPLIITREVRYIKFEFDQRFFFKTNLLNVLLLFFGLSSFVFNLFYMLNQKCFEKANSFSATRRIAFDELIDVHTYNSIMLSNSDFAAEDSH